jgi:hypothetical protein
MSEAWATQTWEANSRAENANFSIIGELIRTVLSACDMMQIVDALGKDGVLRLWGESTISLLSYRHTLG